MKDRFEEFYELLKLDRKNSSWSKSNTLESRFEELVKEIEEIQQALERKDSENLKEEIGDALWDLLFLIVIAEENNMFTAKEILENSIQKLKRRKPWILTEEKISVDEEIKRWKKAKLSE